MMQGVSGMVLAAFPWFVLTAGVAGAAPEAGGRFAVRDFGAVPDSGEDAGKAIREALAAATAAGPGAEVVLEAGTYRIAKPEGGRSCLDITQATGLTLRGAGPATRLLVTDPASGAVSAALSRNVTLRDFTIDYDPAPFCQGTVRAVDPEGGSFDLEVDEGYSTPDAANFVNAAEPYGKWGMIIDPETRRIRAGTPDHYMTPKWEPVAGRTWRFFTAAEHYRRNLVHMRPGDRYVHLARGHGSALFAHGCEGIRMENVVIHAAPGLAVGLVANSVEAVVRGLQVRFPAGSDRLLTTNADGVHCQQNRTGPVIENCFFEGMADDAVNIYAPPNVLREIRSPTEWAVTPGCLVLPGERLQVLDPKTGTVKGMVRAAGVKPENGLFVLTLEAPFEGAVPGPDHRSADTLYNVDACGAGFRIVGNRMRGNRRYGCMLRAGDGLVANNVFEDTTGAGVVLTNEPDWPEGPVPWNIVVRGNRFVRGGTCLGYADSAHGAALSVRSVKLGHGLAEASGIRDIVLEDNEIVDRAGAAIFVGGAEGVRVANNRISARPEAELRRDGPAILVERSSRVELVGNTVSDPRPGTTAAVEIGPGVSPGTAGVTVSELRADLAPGRAPLSDRRQP